ncbi:hypothetical protein [Streptomyces sp. YIM 130001]|uniref:hypothetical protein n=1 Tax=Streptomyces sp. YIM 130001 TaxID=2259644 RepID=UPI000E654D27|nr:hypothetical protein [Streptomyces sp. YIM 130001]
MSPSVVRRRGCRTTGALLAAVLGAGLLTGLTSAPSPARAGEEATGARPVADTPPVKPAEGSSARPAACPDDLRGLASCYAGQDRNGAHYTVAVPEKWNGDLVLHAHGGPDLEAPGPERSAEDLERWSVMVKEGYAWAGSSFRRGGYGARMAAADTERLRRLFRTDFARPGRTLLHGQSWGGDVAAKAAETYGARSERPVYDGVLLTNGLVAGASRGYDYRVDLRVVYQYFCGNHPRPSEPQYPLWQGLPADSTMTSADLKARVQECTGVESEPEDRTARQQRNLSAILGVVQVPERTLVSHLNFATFTFRDIVHQRLDGRNPFGNRGVRYSGSPDDRALNAGVQRFSADPSARRDLSYDSDLTGRIRVPVLTLHAIDDPTVFVEHESAYRASVEGAGRGRHLVQTFTKESEHSALSDSGYAAAVRSLASWVDTGRKPVPGQVAERCTDADATYGTGCFFDSGYRPGSYASRVDPRPGGLRWPAMTAAQERVWSRIEGVGIAP